MGSQTEISPRKGVDNFTSREVSVRHDFCTSFRTETKSSVRSRVTYRILNPPKPMYIVPVHNTKTIDSVSHRVPRGHTSIVSHGMLTVAAIQCSHVSTRERVAVYDGEPVILICLIHLKDTTTGVLVNPRFLTGPYSNDNDLVKL